jgi:hypothetical protein
MPNLIELPQEVLNRICTLAHAEASSSKDRTERSPYRLGQIHRSFLPWARQVAFREPVVRTYVALEGLIRLARANRDVASSIKELILTMKRERADGNEPTELINRDNGRPTDIMVESFLASLPNLCRLVVDNSHRLIELVLSEEVVTNGTLNKLSRLVIKDQLHSWHTPFKAERYRHILSLPALKWFEIDSVRYSTVPYTAAASDVLLPPFKGTLTLHGHLSTKATNLISSFPSLSSLVLHDISPGGTDSTALTPVLEALAQPGDLHFLSLKQDNPLTLHSFSLVFPSFTGLQDLHLYQHTYSKDLLPLLPSLVSLERLFLHHNIPIVASDLLILVSPTDNNGVRFLPKLHRLVLDNVRRMEIRKVETSIWPAGYEVEGVLDLVSEGEKAGIVVEGELIEMARKKHAQESA